MLITPEYRQLNRGLHRRRPDYGTSGHRWARTALSLALAYKARDILDYGCGKQTLAEALKDTDYGATARARTGKDLRGYDPALEGLDASPDPADIVVCGDVLEHVEPECLDAVLDDLRRVTRKAALLVVATRPAEKTLEDGRNAHLTVEPAEWWLPRITRRFTLVRYERMGEGEFVAIVEPKPC